MIATTVQVVALFAITVGNQVGVVRGLVPVLLTLVTCLALNVVIVGLNQITDVGIDRINKPWLPLASGVLRVRQGQIIVALAGLTALLGAWAAGPFLLATVLAILVIGSAYSAPPLRLKRFSLWAAICIALARGVIANVGVALHYGRVFDDVASVSHATLAALAAFFFGFGLVIAIYKDIPDLIGDRAYGIRTFTVAMGARAAFDLGRAILTASYAGVMLIAALRLPQPNAALLLSTQGLALWVFWTASGRVDPVDPSAITRFYQLLWGLFYAQYVVLGVYQVSQGVV